MSNQKFDAVIFDFDGVLADSIGHYIHAIRDFSHQTIRSQSLDPKAYCDEKLYEDYGGTYDMHQAVGTFYQRYGFAHKAQEQAYAELMDRVLIKLGDVEEIPGLRSFIKQLTIPYGIATAGCAAATTVKLETTGLGALFQPERIVTADDVTNNKPAPDVYQLAAQRLGVAPETCLVIEDSVGGLTAARRAGAVVWGFTGASDDPQVQTEKLLSAGAAAVFHDYDRLAQAYMKGTVNV